MDKLIDPASAPGAVLWGIVAGILTTFLLFLFGLMFTQLLIPWYEALVYKGWDVSGLWVYRQNLGGIDYGYQMVLKQHAHRLNGTITITKSGAPSGPKGRLRSNVRRFWHDMGRLFDAEHAKLRPKELGFCDQPASGRKPWPQHGWSVVL